MHILAIAVILMVVGYTLQAFMQKPVVRKPPSLDDFEIPQVQEGTPHAVVFGDGWLQGWQVLWYGNYRTKKVKSKAGKK
jgi:hypothetical protein